MHRKLEKLSKTRFNFKGGQQFINLPNKYLVLELGVGVGMHPIINAKTNKDHYIIAIEKTKKKFKKFERRFCNHNLNNLLIVHDNALNFVPSKIKDDSINEIKLYYPNPYPKEAQANKRWHRMPFMFELLKKLKIGGKVECCTNIKSYSIENILYFEKVFNLKLIEEKILNKENTHFYRTHFEKKYITRGDLCYNLIFLKV